MKKFKVVILIVLSLLLFVACKSDVKNEEKIKIGASAMPHAQILEHVKEDLKNEGINLEIVVTTDYVKPNLDLDSGDLYANFFQHIPYLDKFNSERNLDLVSIGGVHIEPLGVYSNKIKSLEEIKEGDEITIPNDPSNGARALLLLSKAGLIELKDDKNPDATEADIVKNEKNLKITAIDAAQLPRTLEDVAASVINTNYALEAKIDVKSSLITEDKDSPYVNIIAVKKENKDSEISKKIIKILNSDKVRKFIEEEYKGAIVPAF